MGRTPLLFGSALGLLCLTLPAQKGLSADPPPPLAALCVSRPNAAAVPTTLAQWADGAQIFDRLGTYHRPISTVSPDAQAYFDQGMRLLWAFNHDEATRSFARAAQLDPDCAMCLWGVALTVGPNYNLPMMAEARARVAYDAVQQAKRLAQSATPVERALIAAVAQRYPNAQPLDPSNEAPVLAAYAQAMEIVAGRFPDDSDVQTLTAEALMNINAWKLWSLEGAPAEGTEKILARLESVLAKDQSHPGANHYYIHATEASPHPERAVASADRLAGMMPAAGHLEHMPAHIFQRVGRYADAATANRNGADADLAYYAKTTPPDYYAMYTAHNYQFLTFSTAMQGRRADTIDAARRSRAIISDDLLMAMPGADWYVAELYAAMLRFGLWDEMLAQSAPDPKLAGLTAGYHYGRVIALAATGRVEEARTEQTLLENITASTSADAGAGLNAARDVFAVATLVGEARIAGAVGNTAESIALLTEAAAKEDHLAYDEPSDWFFPVRHLLGAALLQAGRAQDAESVYLEDLRLHPGNGWALLGLTQALSLQHRDTEALLTRKRFEQAWKNADIELTASAF
jgi:tetratricopeptide (TPR) repeat protein